MVESERIMQQLIAQIKLSKEYNQYQMVLQRVKSQPEIYDRIGDYRRRSLALQLSENVDFIQENNNLQKEFQDLQANGLASEFFAAEHQYCGMIRNLQTQFLEGVGIEIDFLNS